MHSEDCGDRGWYLGSGAAWAETWVSWKSPLQNATEKWRNIWLLPCSNGCDLDRTVSQEAVSEWTPSICHVAKQPTVFRRQKTSDCWVGCWDRWSVGVKESFSCNQNVGVQFFSRHDWSTPWKEPKGLWSFDVYCRRMWWIWSWCILWTWWRMGWWGHRGLSCRQWWRC